MKNILPNVPYLRASVPSRGVCRVLVRYRNKNATRKRVRMVVNMIDSI